MFQREMISDNEAKQTVYSHLEQARIDLECGRVLSAESVFDDILEELANRVEPLEKQAAVAKEYLELAQRLRTLEINIFLIRYDRAKERIAEAEQLLAGLKEAIAHEEKRADELSAQREKANEGAQRLENEVTAAHDAVLELTRETEAREGELGVLRAEINRMEKDVLVLSQEEDVKRARSAALDEEIAKNERDALANRTKIIELTRQLSQKEEALQTAQEEAREAEEKLEAHKSAIIDAMNRLSDVRTSEARLSTMRKELERRGHPFVRYADDSLIFCKSKRGAERVCEGLTKFIEKKLHLKVNLDKTEVGYVRGMKYLGHAFYKTGEG